jgi:TolB-like protein/DNA-binding winged helix-turn-helix (wHTH) protein/Flp pilus assembly protein TadD
MVMQINKRYRLGDYSLEPDKRLLSRAGQPVRLTQRPLQVLLYLIERRERVVTREELLDAFWDGREVYDDTLRKCVGAIRKALDDRSEEPRFIETHYAEGYRYIGPLVEEDGAAFVEVERTRGVKIVIEEEEVPTPQPASETALTIHQPKKLTKLLPAGRAWAVALGFVAVTLAGSGLLLYRATPTPAQRATALHKPMPSIAVLPLKNLSGDPAQEYFSDGLTESLITELSKIQGLKVISRSSAFTFKGKETDAREAGRQLQVGTILEGNVRQSGATVRVAVRLVSAEDGRVLWASDTYNRALKDIFAVQDEIGCSVANSLKVVLCESAEPHRRGTQNIEAYQAYLKGRYYWNKRTAEGMKRAIEYFEQASTLDPNYALAYTGLADSYAMGVWYIPLSAAEALPKLKAAATRAVELDGTLAEAHLAMSNVYSFEWRWLEGAKAQERARALNPGYATAHHWYALYLALLGRSERALAEIQRARELDPLSLVINTDVGWVYYLARRYTEAIAQYQKTLELDPSFTLAHFDLALAYAQMGQHEAAIAEMHKAAGRGSDYLGGLGYVYAVAGQHARARQALAELQQLARKQYVPPYHFAWIYTGLGDKEQALALLEQVYQEHTQHVVDFKTHPLFDPLRPDARFQALVRRVGLPD